MPNTGTNRIAILGGEQQEEVELLPREVRDDELCDVSAGRNHDCCIAQTKYRGVGVPRQAYS
jgi:hypothetical protein